MEVLSKSSVPRQCMEDIDAPPLWTLSWNSDPFCRARCHRISDYPSSNPSTPISPEPLRTTRSSVSTVRRVPLSVPRWPLAEGVTSTLKTHMRWWSSRSLKYFGIWSKHGYFKQGAICQAKIAKGKPQGSNPFQVCQCHLRYESKRSSHRDLPFLSRGSRLATYKNIWSVCWWSLLLLLIDLLISRHHHLILAGNILW